MRQVCTLPPGSLRVAFATKAFPLPQSRCRGTGCLGLGQPALALRGDGREPGRPGTAHRRGTLLPGGKACAWGLRTLVGGDRDNTSKPREALIPTPPPRPLPRPPPRLRDVQVNRAFPKRPARGRSWGSSCTGCRANGAGTGPASSCWEPALSVCTAAGRLAPRARPTVRYPPTPHTGAGHLWRAAARSKGSPEARAFLWDVQEHQGHSETDLSKNTRI